MSTRPSASIRHLLAAAALLAGAASPAFAVQKMTGVCNVTGPGGNVVNLKPEMGSVVFNDLAVTLSNTGTTSKKAYVQLSADAGIDSGAELRLLFTIDGGAPFYAGPQNLANHAEYWQGRSSQAILTIAPGTHVVKPAMYVSGVAGLNAFIDDRCISINF